MQKRWLLITLVVLLLSSCGEKKAVYRKVSGATWGTTYNITYKAVEDLNDSIVAVMQQVDESLSAFNNSSLVSRINRGEHVKVDGLFTAVFDISKRVNRCSGGAFDPTVSPLINLWGFGYDKSVGGEPTQTQIDSALCYVGIADCSLVDEKIVKKHPLTEFNFSAVAKGYGCDLIAEMMRRNDCEDYMIEIGGEVVLSGENPDGKPWRIMIDAPIANNQSVTHQRYAVIEPGACGIATSGNYRNYKEIAGRRVGHTISPTTGRPVETTTASVTVIAPTAMVADAFATACMAMPLADAMKMMEAENGVEAMFIISAGVEKLFTATTSGFPEIKEQ